MKYFEAKQPYYALIQTESKEEARDLYNNIVAADDDKSTEFAELTEDEAWERYIDPKVDREGEIKATEELKNEFYDKNNAILLVDGSLI